MRRVVLPLLSGLALSACAPHELGDDRRTRRRQHDRLQPVGQRKRCGRPPFDGEQGFCVFYHHPAVERVVCPFHEFLEQLNTI